MFSIVIPLHNEEKNIISLLDEIYSILNNYEQYEIVLVDDCSTDNTLDFIKKYKQNRNIKILNKLYK